MSAVDLQSVDIVFGSKVQAALAMADKGGTRDQIQKATGALVGAFNVNLSIEQGEICVLMGLSGSGKSTILRAINGLNKVARGKVLVSHEGQKVDVVSCRPDMLRAIRLKTVSMVFQSFGLLPWRSVRDNVGFGLEIRGVPSAERRKLVEEKLEIVGLSNWADKPVQELSGGMQQRVGLARAFATDADILLMDEPFSALDPLIRDKLQDDLLDLQKQMHKTIVFVSHDLAEALKIGNRIGIMEGGHLVQYGTPTDIVLRPANAYVAEFVKRMNPLDVLKSDSVMTPVSTLKREDHTYILDGGGEMRLTVCSEGRPESIQLNGRKGTLGKLREDGTPENENCDLIVAPMELPLKTAMDLRSKSDYPIIFVDQLGVLAGMCDHQQIYKALLKTA
jgi:glycine betaine/proline transport system ATP-binding protein